MASITWTGVDDNDVWNDGLNWAGGVVPGPTDTAIFTFSPLVVAEGDVGSLELLNGAILGFSGSPRIEAGLAVGASSSGQITGNGSIGVGAWSALYAGPGVTSASGSVGVEGDYGDATYDWAGSGSTQAVSLYPAIDGGHAIFEFSTAFGGTVVQFGAGDTIAYTGSGTVNNITISTNSATFATSAGNYTINFGPDVDTSLIQTDVATGSISSPIVCFATGSHIRTMRGEIPVEDLKVGDLAVTSSGAARPIIWIGSRTVRYPSRDHWPVRVRAGAFGENRPSRDLWLSPGHAVCLDLMGEVLIPIGDLINETSIVAEPVREITYWHVELDSHDVLLAEGLSCESYMDCGNRAWFAGGSGECDPAMTADASYARPYVNSGLFLAAVHSRLADRAGRLGLAANRAA